MTADLVGSLVDAAKYIIVMLAGVVAANRLGVRAPPHLFTLVVALLVVIVSMGVAHAFREPLGVITVSLLYTGATLLGSALLAYPLRVTASCGSGASRRGFATAVISSMVIGVLLGLAGLPAPLHLINPLLLVLVFLAGLELGASDGIPRLEARLALLPLASLAGSLIAAIPFYLLAGISLAIAAGMGWYTFTSPYLLVASGGNERLAAIALLSNLFREQATILIVTLLGCKLPPQCAVALGGVTTMDTTLPVYTGVYGARGALLAVINGAILTILVPLLVPLLYTLFH